MKGINLRRLPVDELLVLRDRINATLDSRVEAERRNLETRLKRLQKFQADSGAKKSKAETTPAKKIRKAKRKSKKVAIKYRNPDNPSETWTGRGLQPRWMKSAMTGGKKLEDFRIQ